jgi:hypothetical protein
MRDEQPGEKWPLQCEKSFLHAIEKLEILVTITHCYLEAFGLTA